METCSPPGSLHCLMLNTGELCRHADEELGLLEFEHLRPLLPPCGGSLLLGNPPCRLRLSWLGAPRYGGTAPTPGGSPPSSHDLQRIWL